VVVVVDMMVATGPHDRAQYQQASKVSWCLHTLPSSSAVEAGARGKVGEGNFAG
jgi:hypothetical protein